MGVFIVIYNSKWILRHVFLIVIKGMFCVTLLFYVSGVSLANFQLKEELTDYKRALKHCDPGWSRLPRGQTKEELKNISHKMTMYNISVVWLNITFSTVDSDKKFGKNYLLGLSIIWIPHLVNFERH